MKNELKNCRVILNDNKLGQQCFLDADLEKDTGIKIRSYGHVRLTEIDLEVVTKRIFEWICIEVGFYITQSRYIIHDNVKYILLRIDQ